MYFSPIGGHPPDCGVVQIAHGVGEHMRRYAELAETLVHGEFVVYGNDHRGHGLTAKASGSLATADPAVLINSSKTWLLWEPSRSTSIRASRTLYWDTA